MKMPPPGCASGPFTARQAMTYLAPGWTSRLMGTPLGDVEPRDGASLPVALAVYPHLAVVVDAGLEVEPGALDLGAVHPFRYGDRDAVPAEGEASGHGLLDVVAGVPARVVVVRKPRRAFGQPRGKALVGLSGYQSRREPPSRPRGGQVFPVFQVQVHPDHPSPPDCTLPPLLQGPRGPSPLMRRACLRETHYTCGGEAGPALINRVDLG